jgi:hypothetical protein
MTTETLAALARKLNVPRAYLRGIEPDDAGRYDLAAAREWLRSHGVLIRDGVVVVTRPGGTIAS